MNTQTKAEIVVVGGVAAALAWFWLARHHAAQTGGSNAPILAPDGGGVSLPPIAHDPGASFSFRGGDATIDLGDIYMPSAPAMPSASHNPGAGVGTCGCGCNGEGGQSQQFASSDALAAFYASLPQSQPDPAPAPVVSIAKPKPFPWVNWNDWT
jgi:hypothetical protein